MTQPDVAASRSRFWSIAASLALVSAFLLVGKLAGAAKEVIFAAELGTSSLADAYAYLFGALTWPVAAITSAVNVVIVPLMVRARTGDGTDSESFFRELSGMLLVWTSLVALVAGAGLWLGLHYGVLGLAEPAAREAMVLLVPLLIVVPLGTLTALLSSRLMASKSSLNSLLEALPSIVLAAAVLLVARPDAALLGWATVSGFAMWGAALWFAQGPRLAPRLPILACRSPLWSPFLRNFGVVLVGQLAFTASGVLDQVLAAQFGSGSNATMGYALRLIALVTGLGSVALARVLLPILSETAVQSGRAAEKITRFWAVIVFWTGTAAAIIGWGMAPFGVSLLFERGAFTAEDTRAVTELVRFGLVQLPFYFSGLVLAQLIASTGNYLVFLKIGIIGFVAKFSCSIIFMHYMGIEGIFLGTALSSFAVAVSMYVMSGLSRRNENQK
jgi:putative peptidoglycan lipid II flippase